MNVQTNPDVLMPDVVAAIQQQLLTVAESTTTVAQAATDSFEVCFRKEEWKTILHAFCTGGGMIGSNPDLFTECEITVRHNGAGFAMVGHEVSKEGCVETTTTAGPAAADSFEVSFRKDEWNTILDVYYCGGGMISGKPDLFADCEITVRHNAAGFIMVGYVVFEDGAAGRYTMMATTETTSDAINKVCAHLVAHSNGRWGKLNANLKAKFRRLEEKVTCKTVNPINPMANYRDMPYEELKSELARLRAMYCDGYEERQRNDRQQYVACRFLETKTPRYPKPISSFIWELNTTRPQRDRIVPVNDAPIRASVIEGLQRLSCPANCPSRRSD